MQPKPRPELPMNADMLYFAKMAVRMYAETHPRPPHVSQKQGAEMLGISTTTMSKLVKFGTFKLNKCGLIPIDQIDAALAAR